MPIFYLDRISFVAQSSIYGRFYTIQTHRGVKKQERTQPIEINHVCLCLRWKFEWNKHKQYWMLIKLEVEITMRNTICFAIFSTWSSGSWKRRNEDNKKQLFKIVFRVVMRVTIDCKQWLRSIPKKKQLLDPVFFGGIQKIDLLQIDDSPQNIENFAWAILTFFSMTSRWTPSKLMAFHLFILYRINFRVYFC